MILYIKNMVSHSCKMAVTLALDELDINHGVVSLGEVEIFEFLTTEKLFKLIYALSKWNLEIIDNKKNILVEKIKKVIIDMVFYENEIPEDKISYIEKKLNLDYTYLANQFVKATKKTIEHYFILIKIEKVKELIINNELIFSEIAFKLNYYSESHLSKQFKKVTGVTLAYFKKNDLKRDINLEDI